MPDLSLLIPYIDTGLLGLVVYFVARIKAGLDHLGSRVDHIEAHTGSKAKGVIV